MIPNTLLGLLVFAASIGPGFIFVYVAEKRSPRPKRSAILEAAELVSVGGAASMISLIAALLLNNWVGWVDTDALTKDGARYVLGSPERGLLFLLAVLASSYLLTLAAAYIVYRGVPATLQHHSV